MTKDSDQTSSHLASLANLSQSQEKENQRKMTEISGKKLLELSKSPDQLGLLEKMLVELLNSISTPYLRTWRVRTTPRGALVFQLKASVQNIKGNAFGLWRTPDGSTGGSNIKGIRRCLDKNQPLLRPSGHAIQVRLTDQILEPRLYPTPTTQDSKNNGNPSQMRRNTKPLNAVIGGKLNPNFVEFLMGFPMDWTKIDQIESKLSETQSFHKSHTTSDLPLKKLWRTPTAMDGQINNEEKYAARILKGKTTRKSKEKVQINLATEVQVEKLRNDPARVDELLADEMIKRTKLPSQKEFVEYIRSQTNPQELSKLSGIKFSTVEHWFRRGKYFSHPSIEDWNKIKLFLKEIKFDEELTFTESIEWE